MNNKGFTLIELLAVIVILGVVLTIVVVTVSDEVGTSKDGAYKILISDIKTAAENYFMECRYGNSKDNGCDDKYDNNDKTLTVNISDLVIYGFLTPSEKNGTEVKNPKTDSDISGCNFTIKQEVDNNYKVTYSFSVNNNCEIKTDLEESN